MPQRWDWRLLAAQDQPPPKPTFKSAVDRVPPSNPMEYNANTSAQGGRLVMIAVDSNMASAVHARRCHGARGGSRKT